VVCIDSGYVSVLWKRKHDINVTTAAAVYVAELAQAETRGFYTGLIGVAIAGGYTVAALMGLAFSYATNPHVQWRTPLGLCLVLSTVLLVALYFIPESPRFLLLKGKSEEAWEIVSKLHSDPADENQAYVKEEFFQMRTQLEFDRTLDSSWMHLLKKPSYRKRALMACFVTFLSQSTAVLVAAAYVSVHLGDNFAKVVRNDANKVSKGPSLYASLGFDVKQSLILQCGWIAGKPSPSVEHESRFSSFVLINVTRFHPCSDHWCCFV
jgi:MFS family permease